MVEDACCVCGRHAGATPLLRVGQRLFCETHRERALRANGQTWSRSGIFEILFLTVFVYVAARLLESTHDGIIPSTFGIGLLLSLVPAAIWMLYVYRQDRIEPEPWAVVLGVFLMGGLVTEAVALPLAEHLFVVGDWQHRSTLATWCADIFVRGTLAQLAAYVAVRYTVYITDEFDEPLDGMVYATAASLGTATVVNMHFVLSNDGLLPLEGLAHITSTAFVHVASAAVLGYGFGLAHFDEKRGPLWLVMCFAGAVIINGGLTRLATSMGTQGSSFHPWMSFAVAAAMAGVILVGIDVLAARLCRAAMVDTNAPPPPPPPSIPPREEGGAHGLVQHEQPLG